MEETINSTIETRRRRVLVVDDEFVNRELLGMIVGEEYEVLFAENGRQALGLIRQNKETLSLVMLDIIMPEMDGFAVLETMHADAELSRIPVIVLTSEKTAELKSLQMGAADFITKPYDMPEIILARVSRIIELSEGRGIISATEKDELTGLYTRSFFYEYAQQLERYHPEWEMDAVAINIDRFHLVNELYGREFGDRVLRLLARRIQMFLSTTDGIGCRQEGDAFFLYCVHRDDYEEVLEEIQKGLAGISRTVRIRLRIGVYANVDHKLDIGRQFDRAKTACDMLRTVITKSVLIYDNALHRKELYSEQLINDLPKALEQHQIQVFYQPKYNIRGDKPVLSSAEALVRWKHPDLGMVSPGDFIPLFESNGLITSVDNYVWYEAARQLKAWRDEYGVDFRLSINISRVDIYDPEIVEKLVNIADEFELPRETLLLEITESAYSEDAAQLVGVVEELRSRGFLIEMDDFGSGYSSLGSICQLPVDVIKLDMKFIESVRENEKGLRLIKLIMDVADSLSAPVVAEGVETAEECEMLRQVGCSVVQGYYFSRPVSAEEFVSNFKEAVKC